MQNSTRHSLSILLPSYNNVCKPLVLSLKKQADEICARNNNSFEYEIIVADDGSTDKECIAINSEIKTFACCRFISYSHNMGRAAIRNYLAREAKFDKLLFIDSDMSLCKSDFINVYLKHFNSYIVDGSVTVSDNQVEGNLRYKYELNALDSHTAEKRSKNPYAEFRTTNFMINRNLVIEHPFDERFKLYGYEDVLFGKQFKEIGIPIQHIDNPVRFISYEDNESFLKKTDESLLTLNSFRDELSGYSRILTTALKLKTFWPCIIFFHELLYRFELYNLKGKHPSLTTYKFYKLGYLIKLLNKQHQLLI
jgi:glycosyltransferase involved in cell wall biosynthesis